MATERCPTCEEILFFNAARIATGENFRCSQCLTLHEGKPAVRCPGCGSSLWNGSSCSACGCGKSATVEPTQVTNTSDEPVTREPPRTFSFDSQGNWGKDIDDVRVAALWLWGLIIIIATPTLPAIITIATSGKKAGLDQAQVLGQVFLLTFPLSIGVAIDTAILLLVGKHNAWPKAEQDKWFFWGAIACVFIVSALVGNWAGLSAIPDVIPEKVKGGKFAPFIMAGQLLQTYFILYGPQLFFSSVAVGGFAGWAFSMKIVPNLGPPRK